MRQIILDTETTGLQVESGHRIIEIGCVELINRKLTGNHYHVYINPMREVEEGAIAVHGITNEFLQSKPEFVSIAEEFMNFISGAELIIHNAPFDVGFINAEFSQLKKSWKPLTHYCRIVDTLALARQIHVGQRNSLDALCKRYSIDNTHRDLHGALLDANLLARVYLAMTGGQVTLFGDSEKTDITTEQVTTTTVAAVAKPRDLVVIKATEEELTIHQQRIQQMSEHGKSLWVE